MLKRLGGVLMLLVFAFVVYLHDGSALVLDTAKGFLPYAAKQEGDGVRHVLVFFDKDGKLLFSIDQDKVKLVVYQCDGCLM